jgi:O-antigen ligase
MGNILQNEWRNRAIFAAIVFMLISLFVSRAFLSVSLIVFLAATIIHRDILSQFSRFFRSPLLVSMSFLFLIPFISGLWSSNTDTWLGVMQLKLPFLFLPLAFAGNWQLQEKQWKIIAWCFLLLVTVSCCVSLWQYFQNMNAINESYLRAKTLPTPLDDDHVRFSWLVSIAVVCGTLLIWISKNKKTKLLLTLLLLLLVIYLHVLSARTGLALVYFFFLCFALYLAVQRRKYFFIILPALIVVAVTSWWSFPTLRNRIKYVVYDFSFLKNNNNIPGTSDANRLISLNAGWHILHENPLLGVGAGDIRDETNKWYAANTPGIIESDKLFPSSEWIVYGDIAGWPGVLFFTIVIIFPFFIKQIRHRFFWIMLIAMGICSFMVETTLEIQFGIFIYCFTILWWWKWLKLQKE